LDHIQKGQPTFAIHNIEQNINSIVYMTLPDLFDKLTCDYFNSKSFTVQFEVYLFDIGFLIHQSTQ
jgi:hypothetical protein